MKNEDLHEKSTNKYNVLGLKDNINKCNKTGEL